MLSACLWVLCNVFVCFVCDLPCDGGWFVCLCVSCEVCGCLMFNMRLCVLCANYFVTFFVFFLFSPFLFFAGGRLWFACVRFVYCACMHCF